MSARKRRAKAQAQAAEGAGGAVARVEGTRVLLVASLTLTPLAFSRFTLEAFEFPKALVVIASAIIFVGPALVRLAATDAPGPAARTRLREALRDPIAVGVIAFAASAAASTATSICPLTSLVGDHESFGGLVTVLGLATLFLAARQLATDAADGLAVMAASVAPATAAALYAVVQTARVDPILWGGTARYSGVIRVFSTFGHPNLLGAYLSMSVPLTAGLVVLAFRRGRTVPGVILLVAALLQMTTAVVTSSRAAWLALIASAALLAAGWIKAGSRRAALLVLGLPMLAAVTLAGASQLRPSEPGLLASLGERARRIAEAPSRREIWRAAGAIHADHPWLGSGLDTFRLAFSPRRTTAYAELEWNTTPTHAHNGALQVLATQGLVGGTALGWLAAALLWRSVRLLRRESVETRESVLVLGAGLAAFTVTGSLGGTSPATAGLAAALAGTLSGMGSRPETRGRRSPGDLGLGMSLALASAAMLLVLNAPAVHDGLELGLAVLLPALAAGLGARAVVHAGNQAPLSRPGREAGTPRRSGPAPASARRARLGRAGVWIAATGALILLVLRPLAADLRARRGLELAALDPEAAIAELRRAVELAPWREVLWLRLGAANHAAGVAATSAAGARDHLGSARQAFERAVALAPPDPYAHMPLAGTLAELVRRGEVPGPAAIARADQAILLDSNNALFYVAATNIALVAGDAGKARDYARRCLERYPSLGAPRYLLGRIALQEGHTEEAVREIEAALRGEWHGDAATREFVAVELERARRRLDRPSSPAAVPAAPPRPKGSRP